jgi:hypothetical protein
VKPSPEVFPPRVRIYLESTRFSLHRVLLSDEEPEQSELLYGPFRDYLNRIGEAFDAPATFGVVYTDMMRSEAITIHGQSFIVHDRYFGQVINMMNRLLLYGASRNTKLSYFHKVASQMLSRYGMDGHAIFAANRYREARSEMDHLLRQREVGSLRHGLYTSIQELLVLLHEQAHVVFKRHPEMLTALSQDVREWVLEFGKKRVASDELLEQDWTDAERAFLLEREAEIAESNRAQEAICEAIATRQDLVEEFACDQLAIINVLGYFAGDRFTVPNEEAPRAFDVTDKVSAVLLCFLNMRTLQSMETLCSLHGEGTPVPPGSLSLTEGIYATFYNARLHRAKELVYDLMLDSEEEFRAVHQAVMQLMDHHTDEIYSPAISSLQHLLNNEEVQSEAARIGQTLRDSREIDDPIGFRYVSAFLHLVPDRQPDAPDGDGAGPDGAASSGPAGHP